MGWEDPLEKEMATCSSILAWEIPRTEEPGRLQSIGLQRVCWITWLSTNAQGQFVLTTLVISKTSWGKIISKCIPTQHFGGQFGNIYQNLKCIQQWRMNLRVINKAVAKDKLRIMEVKLKPLWNVGWSLSFWHGNMITKLRQLFVVMQH